MEHRLETPLTEEAVGRVSAGDTVYLTGKILTSRDAAHKRLIALIDADKPLPYELKDTVVYYSGPCPAPPGLDVGAVFLGVQPSQFGTARRTRGAGWLRFAARA